MKFEYEHDEPENRKLLAYIDEDGDLNIWADFDCKGVFRMFSDGDTQFLEGETLESCMKDFPAAKKFYKDDKITITF